MGSPCNTPLPIRVWFTCKVCNCFFQQLNGFIDHKKKYHSSEFRRIKCIVFEENSLIDLSHAQEGESGLLSSPIPTAPHVNQLNLEVNKEFVTNSCVPLRTQPELESTHQIGPPMVIKEEITNDQSHPHQVQLVMNYGYPPQMPIETITLAETQVDPCIVQSGTPDPNLLDPRTLGFKIELMENENFHYNEIHTNNVNNANPNPNTNPYNNIRSSDRGFHFKSPDNFNNPKGPPFKCYLCPRKFSQKKSWRIHTDTHKTKEERDKNRRFKCSYAQCDKSFYYSSNLTIHLRSHTGERPFKCNQLNCTKAFRGGDELRKHLRTHSSARPFHCPQPNCSKTYKTRSNLTDHLDTHPDVRKRRLFKCGELSGNGSSCGKSFSTISNLNKHTRNMHNNPGNSFFKTEAVTEPEPEPDPIFESSGHFYSGRESHKSESNQEKCLRPFKCTEPNCGKAFKHRSNLHVHLAGHSDYRPVKCPYPNCTRSFKVKSDLQKHTPSHSDSRPFNCPRPDCNKTFKYQKSIKDHLRTHTGERPFQCTEDRCYQFFSTRSHLSRHKRNIHHFE